MQSKIWTLVLLLFCFTAILPANNQIAARKAFRVAVEKNPDAFRKYLNDKDPEIRRFRNWQKLLMIMMLPCSIPQPKLLPDWQKKLPKKFSRCWKK